MKPYYVLIAAGALDDEGNSEKFGLIGADSPEQAEEVVLKLAEKHAKEPCSLAVLQLYRNYPGTLLREIEARKVTLEGLRSENAWLRRQVEIDRLAREAEAQTRLVPKKKARSKGVDRVFRSRVKKRKGK